MARRKIYTKIEDLRKLIVSEIKAYNRQIKECKSCDDFGSAWEYTKCVETLEFILSHIDAEPEVEDPMGPDMSGYPY